MVYLTSDTKETERYNNHDVENINEKIEIISNEEERLKLIGEILSNESSRNIFRLLISNELTAYQLVQKTNLSLSLVLHHLNKMQSAGIVKISKISQTSRSQDMKHYTAKSGIIILPQIVSEKAKTSKTFQNSLKRIMRFCSIGIAGVTSWFVVQTSQPVTEFMSPHPPELASHLLLASLFWPLAISLTVIIIGLVIERIFIIFKKK
jgi:DNA-binding transcriptional ArsR family regulator